MHRRFRLAVMLTAALLAIGLLGSIAFAQGVTVFTGSVTINGQAAPAGTTVIVSLQQDGRQLGSAVTGGSGFAANQYRIDIQAESFIEGKAVVISVPGRSGSATATFSANRVFTRDVDASGTAPAATQTPAATATSPAGPATSVPPTATRPATTPTAPVVMTPSPPPGLGTATPVRDSTPTASPAATGSPAVTGSPTAVATSTRPPLFPTATATPEGEGGGCNAPLARSGEVDAGWLLIGLIAPGVFLGRKLRSKK